MKAFYLILGLILASCSTSKVVEVIDHSSYKQEMSYVQKWVGGAPGSGSGVDLFIPTHYFGNYSKVENVYFEGMEATSINYTDESRAMIMAKFKYPLSEMNMSLDSAQEFSNEAPILVKNTQLNSVNEAIVEVMVGNNKKSVKVTDIIEREMIPYPSMPNK